METKRKTQKKMKLFVWEEVLCDYTCGVVFAMAPTKEEALKLLKKELTKDGTSWKYKEIAGEEPIVYKGKACGYCTGGG